METSVAVSNPSPNRNPTGYMCHDRSTRRSAGESPVRLAQCAETATSTAATKTAVECPRAKYMPTDCGVRSRDCRARVVSSIAAM